MRLGTGNRVFLLQDEARGLVKERFGDIEGLVVEWETRAGKHLDFPTPKQRASVARWISSGIPSPSSIGSQFQLIAFCALLDVDPLAIFDFERNGFFSKFSQIRSAVQKGVGNLGALAPILEFYMPDENWPSDRLATMCYRRPWFSQEFETPENSKEPGYALVRVRFVDERANQPRAIHIAYRNKYAPVRMWRYFGMVRAIEDRWELYSDSGDFQFMPQNTGNAIEFRTYFGRGSAEFRVACIHQFEHTISFPFDDMSVIGFNW